jgi:ankyrin repeat protein
MRPPFVVVIVVTSVAEPTLQDDDVKKETWGHRIDVLEEKGCLSSEDHSSSENEYARDEPVDPHDLDEEYDFEIDDEADKRCFLMVGDTALSVAAVMGHTEMVKLLLDKAPLLISENSEVRVCSVSVVLCCVVNACLMIFVIFMILSLANANNMWYMIPPSLVVYLTIDGSMVAHLFIVP